MWLCSFGARIGKAKISEAENVEKDDATIKAGSVKRREMWTGMLRDMLMAHPTLFIHPL